MDDMLIERDEEMDRTYIPVNTNWEIQTKGKGSSFRIAERKAGGRRWLVADSHIHPALEDMARDVNETVSDLYALAETYRQELQDCYDLAMALDVLVPDLPEAFTGTPCERIKRQLIARGILQHEDE